MKLKDFSPLVFQASLGDVALSLYNKEKEMNDMIPTIEVLI